MNLPPQNTGFLAALPHSLRERIVLLLPTFLLIVITANAPIAIAQNLDGPIPVVLLQSEDGYQLRRGGEPYFIKGVGGDASKEILRDCGGNSFRTWGVDEKTLEQLDEAHRLGLCVTVGIWLGHTQHGFDYDDDDAVAKQLSDAARAVRQYKNHPAVLMWALGNEMEINNESAKLWPAIEQLAAMVKEIDPLHPTMTVIAELGQDNVEQIHRHCPSIDLIGVNSYGGAASLGKRYRTAGGTKPYLITEFGPPGTWETPVNRFGAAEELTSTRKADFYREAYQSSVLGQPGLCLGSYAFHWGNKIEATATWFGMFLPDGSRLAAVDTMQELWNAHSPPLPCPKIIELKLTSNDQVPQGETVTAEVVIHNARQPNTEQSSTEALSIQWTLYREQASYAVQGTGAAPSAFFPDAIQNNGSEKVRVIMPQSDGIYRLYCTVRNRSKNQVARAAVGSLPIEVNGNVTTSNSTRNN